MSTPARCDEAIQLTQRFENLYAAASHQDDLINVRGFTNSFCAWDGECWVVFAVDSLEEVPNVAQR